MLRKVGLVSVLAVALLLLVRPVNAGAFSDRPYVFGAVVLDFGKKIERTGLDAVLTDCSSESYFCAYGFLFHVVLPRHCELFASSAIWSSSGMTMRKLASYQVSNDAGYHSGPPQTVYLLANPRFLDVVYEYRIEAGVVGIYMDPGRDLVDDAVHGVLQRRKSDNSSIFNELRTLDPFAKCN